MSELKETPGLLSPAPLFRGAAEGRPEMGWVGSEKGCFCLRGHTRALNEQMIDHRRA